MFITVAKHSEKNEETRLDAFIMKGPKKILRVSVDSTETKYVRLGADVYPHMSILCPHAARFHEQRISNEACGPRSH